MEWVIAVLGIGCVYFAVQGVADYVKYKLAVEPKIGRLGKIKEDLRERIASSETELAESRQALTPAKEEVERLASEYDDVHRQLSEEEAERDSPSRHQPEE